MISCERCGESNRDDARFCGNCGTAVAVAGSLASLADEPTRPAPGAPAGGLTSEWVAPPTVAETATRPAAAPVPEPTLARSPAPPQPTDALTRAAPVVAEPTVPGAPPPGGPAQASAPDDGARATNIMVAALAVAVVVIVGGIVLLLASGGDDADTSRSGAEPAVSADGGAGAGLPVGDVDPSEPLATDVDTSTSTDAPGATSASAPTEPSTSDDLDPPSTTAAPTTTTTTTTTTSPPVAPSTVPRPDRGPGDLAIAQPILDFPCTGDYVTFVRGIVGGDRLYSEQVEAGLRDFPGSGYLWGGLCPSIRTINDDGDQIYGIIYGPFPSPAEACAVADEFATEGAYVRQLTQVEADIGREVC